MNTSVHTFHAPSVLQRFVFAVVAALRSSAAAWHRSRRRFVAWHELESLDDHLLKDIGLHRSELSSVVAEIMGAAPATRRVTMRSQP